MTGLKYIPLLVDRLMIINPQKIILFGSYAYGEVNADSDIDILVVTDDEILPADFKTKSKIYLKVSKTISDIKKDFPVDLIVHTKPMHQKFLENKSLFALEILKKGKVLYENSN